MTKSVGYCLLTCVALFFIGATKLRPDLLSDKNPFLKGFIGQDILSMAGVMLTITLASAGQIHLTLNDIERQSSLRRPFLHKTRSGVQRLAYCLISLFIGMIVLAIVRPNFAGSAPMESFFNSLALFLLFSMSLIITALTSLVFKIKPMFPGDDNDDEG